MLIKLRESTAPSTDKHETQCYQIKFSYFLKINAWPKEFTQHVIIDYTARCTWKH